MRHKKGCGELIRYAMITTGLVLTGFYMRGFADKAYAPQQQSLETRLQDYLQVPDGRREK